MLTDPIEYVSKKAGPNVVGLRLNAVADDLASDLVERGEELVQCARDSRSRFWYHVAGKPSRRVSPAAAGVILRARFLELTNLRITGDAECVKTWRMIAELVAEVFSSVEKNPAEAWVLAHIVHSPGDYIQRDRLLALMLAAKPGPQKVRGRELSSALYEAGFVSQYETRRRIDGVQTRTWENIKYID